MEGVGETLQADFGQVVALAALASAHPENVNDPSGRSSRSTVTWEWVRRNLDIPGAAVWWLCQGDVARARRLLYDDERLKQLEQRHTAMSEAVEVLKSKLQRPQTAWLQQAWTLELAQRTVDAEMFNEALRYLADLRMLP